ncbi:hypothetical protein [Achromobacter sp. EB05]|uniref:hypothetical protein n=1 Tax=Achromobacter sp. EB05 TaxID=3142974 RepID=UPI0037838BA5
MQQKMFSHREGTVIGSFHHGHAIIEVNQSPETIELMKDPKLISRHLGDEKVLFQLLLEYSAVMHERLHYLHTFGTLGGLSMFTSRMVALRRFVECAIELARGSVVWQLPLSKWVASGDAPDVVRKLLRFSRGFRAGTDYFLAPFSPFGVRGHTTDAWLDVPFPSMRDDGKPTVSKVPAFPMSAGIGSPEVGDLRPVTIVLPMGYEAIVEGIAHGASRSLVGAMFPELPPSTLEHYGPPKTFDAREKENLDAMARQFEIYTASDLLISKYLRGMDIPKFPRELVFRLSDLALSTSFFSVEDINDQQTKVEIINPGYALIRSLTDGDKADLAKGKVPYPDFVQQRYQAILDSLMSQGDWDTVTPQGNLYTAHRVWESFVAQHISVPLLKIRIESNNATFNTESELIKFALLMELPRVEVYNGKLQLHGMPDEVCNAWGQQVFTSELAQQIFADSELLRCPRAHELVPGIEGADFSGGHCVKRKKLGCGTFVPGESGYAPACLFTRTLRALSFIPIQHTSAA